MSSPKPAVWTAKEPEVALLRHLAAAALRSSSALLGQWALRLAGTPARRPDESRLEFHAEAGAPEGALYCDGRLVGWLPGVKRL